jgi:ATP-dependent exoDNAse (exonuclease V) alpha subunit
MDIIEVENIVLNEEQKKAVTNIQNFIKKGSPDEWFVLEGKAGVGKTTVMTHALLPFISKKRIVLSALSHKAKKVIHEKIKTLVLDEPRGLFSHSVASILGMTFDLETGKFVKIYSRKKPKIKHMDIIIVDECSMINEMGLNLIMSEKKKTAKVIFLGDVGQLPPIREMGDENYGKISPTFNTLNRYKLYNRVRQTEGSSILPYSDFYWENSVLSDNPIEDPIPFEKRVDTNDIVFSTNLEQTIKSNKENFMKLRETKMNDLIKVVVYKNNTREMINWYIRDLIYKTPNEYEVGDILIFNDNYGDGDEITIENSTEVIILSIKETKFNGKWDGYYIDVTDNESVWNIEVLSKKSLVDYNRYISELFKKAKSLPLGKSRNNSLKTAWEAKRRFANVDFGYAITSHKSQGSTYKYVIVVEDDILSVGPISSIEKSQSLYTAITRASDKVFIVSELNE